jgi:hypothetical protein
MPAVRPVAVERLGHGLAIQHATMIAEQRLDLRVEEKRQNLAAEQNLTVRELTDAQLDALIQASPEGLTPK